MPKQLKITRREFNNQASRYLGAAAVTATLPAFWGCTSDQEEQPAVKETSPTSPTPQEAPSAPAETAELKMVDQDSPAAKALSYCDDYRSPETHCPQRAGEDKSEQFCSNCLFFNMDTARTVDGSKIEDIETQRDIAVAECQLLPGQGFVAGPGWCQSWAKRQG